VDREFEEKRSTTSPVSARIHRPTAVPVAAANPATETRSNRAGEGGDDHRDDDDDDDDVGEEDDFSRE
jgi:hypothetical protein